MDQEGSGLQNWKKDVGPEATWRKKGKANEPKSKLIQ